MKYQIIIFCVTFIFIHVQSEKIRYDNYTLYKIQPEGTEHVSVLRNLQLKDDRFDFWSDPTPQARFVNVMTSPEHKQEFEKILAEQGIKAEVSMQNVQQFIEAQSIRTYSRRNTRSMTWEAYYTLEDIYAWLDDLAAEYPNIVTVINGGHSYEGREIKGIKISHRSGNRAVVIEGGIHSREWISPATVNYVAYALLTNSDAETSSAARDYDWYLFPVTNPDGYVWTHINNRMWRKNRRPIGNSFGVDLNRNWNSNWLVVGASTNPASDTYAGPGPFSEPETRTFSNFIRTIGDEIDVYLSVHSYGQMILLPFGNSSEPYANYHEAMNIGRRAAGALSVRYGTSYIVGNIVEVLYEATGGSDEWVKEHLHVPIVYCLELRDLWQYGFLLPEDQILPNNLETMDAILDMLHQGKRFGVI